MILSSRGIVVSFRELIARIRARIMALISSNIKIIATLFLNCHNSSKIIQVKIMDTINNKFSQTTTIVIPTSNYPNLNSNNSKTTPTGSHSTTLEEMAAQWQISLILAMEETTTSTTTQSSIWVAVPHKTNSSSNSITTSKLIPTTGLTFLESCTSIL